MRNGNVCPPRTANHTRRNSRIALSIGASIICAGAVTKKRNVRKAWNARCSTYAASAASATVVNSDWNNLLANMHRNMVDE